MSLPSKLINSFWKNLINTSYYYWEGAPDEVAAEEGALIFEAQILRCINGFHASLRSNPAQAFLQSRTCALPSVGDHKADLRAAAYERWW